MCESAEAVHRSLPRCPNCFGSRLALAPTLIEPCICIAASKFPDLSTLQTCPEYVRARCSPSIS